MQVAARLGQAEPWPPIRGEEDFFLPKSQYLDSQGAAPPPFGDIVPSQKQGDIYRKTECPPLAIA